MRHALTSLGLVLLLAGAVSVLGGLSSRAPATDGAPATTYVVVRHAETVGGDSRDPALSERGRERAGRLASMLRSVGVSAVYSTGYARTRQTAEAIAAVGGVGVVEYDPRDPGAFLTRVAREHEGGVVVIVGHSNTAPDLVRRLGGACEDEQLDHDAYDNVFVVTVVEKGRVITHRLHSAP